MNIFDVNNRISIIAALITLLGCAPTKTAQDSALRGESSSSCLKAVTKGLNSLSETMSRFSSKDACSAVELVCIMREGMTIDKMSSDIGFPSVKWSARPRSCPNSDQAIPLNKSAIALFSDHLCPDVLVTNKRLMTDKSFGAYGCMKASDILITRLDNISYSISGAE